MKTAILILFMAIFAVYGDKTPVLIWSSSRSMSDMPQSYIGHTLDTDKFHDDVLMSLSKNKQENLVVFVQDKLSIEDFTNHADVYNPNSDGGAFKNVKTAMDEDFSAQLPSVVNPMSGIDKLGKTFGERVVKVDNPEDIAKLELPGNDKGYLIIVTLKPVEGRDKAGAFQENDAMIGKCIHHMNKRSLKYSAIYTAHSASKRAAEQEEFNGRHLLAAADPSPPSGPQFFKDNIVMMSLTYVNLSVSIPDPKDPLNKELRKSLPKNATNFLTTGLKLTTEKITPVNNTKSVGYKVMIQLNNTAGDLTMSFNLSKNYANEWMSGDGNLTYKGKTDTRFDVTDYPLDYKILAPTNFSFHCSQLQTAIRRKELSNTTQNIAVGVMLTGFQIEAFNGNTTEVFTDYVWDCVEFFTIPIWMGIISTLLLMMIIFFGVSMVANISTMDRFDDPKGKPLTITLNE